MKNLPSKKHYCYKIHDGSSASHPFYKQPRYMDYPPPKKYPTISFVEVSELMDSGVNAIIFHEHRRWAIRFIHTKWGFPEP